MKRWPGLHSVIFKKCIALGCLVLWFFGCATSDQKKQVLKPSQISVPPIAQTQIGAKPVKAEPAAVQPAGSPPTAEKARAQETMAAGPTTKPPAEPPAEKKKAPAAPAPAGPEPPMISLNLEDADLQSVLRALGKLAGIDFIVGQGVKAQVTMKVDRIPATRAFSVIEAILEANNLAAVRSGDVYKIVPVSAAQQQPGHIGMGKDLIQERGYFTQIVPLQYLTVDSLVNILQPLVGQGRAIGHRETNTIILSGPSAVIRELVNTLKALDVKSQQREAQQVYVYYVNNAKASELAGTLMTIFTEGKLGRRPISLERTAPAWGTGIPSPPPPPKPGASYREAEASPHLAMQAALQEESMIGDARIVADDRTNSLIIKATSRDYEYLEPIIKKLDITPKQVVIEALVAEVVLTDNFASSVEQFLRVGNVALQSSFGGAPALLPAFSKASGFTLTFVDRDKFSLFLNLIRAHTKVNTVANPHLLTQNNKQARIQIGQEVPIITGTQSTIGSVGQGGENVFQTIQQKDIGRILTVSPHVNEERQVTLELELEASDTAGTSAQGPSFSKRTVKTAVVVEDGQSLLIGGIISNNKSREVNEVPFLGQLPFLGQFFRTTNESVDKTELIILLTPHVIATPEEGRQLTEEFRRKLDVLNQQLTGVP